MSRRDDLLALAARVEALTGPCRETDRAVAAAACVRSACFCTGACKDAAMGCVCIAAPRYTASLDAAMALVPEGCLWGVKALWADADAIGGGMVYRGSVDRYVTGEGLHWKDGHLALAATPALALTAAALRARAAMESEW